jgi:phosphatidylglycerol---prolipoprotein diacylglyceryl transferase
MSIDQFGIHLGPLYLRFYGMILIAGAFVAGYLASYQAKRRGQNPELVWDGMIWVLVAGIIGARLWHIFTPPPSMVQQNITTMFYLTHPLDAIAVWKGGLGIPGAVAGGMLGLYLFTRQMKLNFAEWADIVAAPLALGQAIGRWGNFVNQELYGAPTTLPWGINIDAAHRVAGFTDPALRFHPTFLYESIGNLLICGALIYLGRRYADKLKTGDLFLVYLILYPALRFFLEFVRLDSSQVLGLNANQALMVILVVVSSVALINRHRERHWRRYEIKEKERAAQRAHANEISAEPTEPSSAVVEGMTGEQKSE